MVTEKMTWMVQRDELSPPILSDMNLAEATLLEEKGFVVTLVQDLRVASHLDRHGVDYGKN